MLNYSEIDSTFKQRIFFKFRKSNAYREMINDFRDDYVTNEVIGVLSARFH